MRCFSNNRDSVFTGFVIFVDFHHFIIVIGSTSSTLCDVGKIK